MADATEIRNGTDRSRDLAREIARVLGCPVEAFSNPTFSRLDQTGELLRVWLMIKDEQDRKKVVSFVRMIADQSAARQRT